MNYEIIELEEKKCYGLGAHIGAHDSSKEEILIKIWGDLMGAIEYQKIKECYGISKNFNMATGEFDYTACVENNIPVLREIEFEKMTLPQGKYAKFKFVGVVESVSITEFYSKAFGFVMMGGELVADMERGINSAELYDEDYNSEDMTDPNSVFYLLIPIK